jgi:hypothetical protein
MRFFGQWTSGVVARADRLRGGLRRATTAAVPVLARGVHLLAAAVRDLRHTRRPAPRGWPVPPDQGAGPPRTRADVSRTLSTAATVRAAGAAGAGLWRRGLYQDEASVAAMLGATPFDPAEPVLALAMAGGAVALLVGLSRRPTAVGLEPGVEPGAQGA